MPKQQTNPKPRDSGGFFYGYVTVGVSFGIMVVAWGAIYTFGVFFKPIMNEFGWTRAMTAGAFSVAMILQGFTSIVAGNLTDRLGPRIVLTVSGFIFGIGYLLLSQMNAIWQLYVFYGVLTGIGRSGSGAPLTANIPKWFITRRGLMTGIVVAGIGVGAAIGSPLASHLLSNYEWRQSLIIIGSVALLVILSLAQLLKRDPSQAGKSPLGKPEINSHSNEHETLSLNLRKAVRFRQFWIVCVLFLCFGYCLFTVMVHIVPHATDLGISVNAASNILVIIGLVSIVGKVISGYISDWWGSRYAFITSFSLLAVCLLGLIFVKDVWSLYVFAALFGFAYGSGVTPQSIIIAELFGIGSIASILGFCVFIFTIGAAAGPFFSGYIFDLFSSYNIAFLVCGLLATFACLLTLFLRPIRDSEPNN